MSNINESSFFAWTPLFFLFFVLFLHLYYSSFLITILMLKFSLFELKEGSERNQNEQLCVFVVFTRQRETQKWKEQEMKSTGEKLNKEGGGKGQGILISDYIDKIISQIHWDS